MLFRARERANIDCIREYLRDSLALRLSANQVLELRCLITHIQNLNRMDFFFLLPTIGALNSMILSDYMISMGNHVIRNSFTIKQCNAFLHGNRLMRFEWISQIVFFFVVVVGCHFNSKVDFSVALLFLNQLKSSKLRRIDF